MEHATELGLVPASRNVLWDDHLHRCDDPAYGITSMFPNLHAESHGESFLDLALSRFLRPGLYLLDEPEAALSLQGQWKLMRIMQTAVHAGAQFIVATHSPALMAFPDACLYELDESGVRATEYDDLAVVQLWRRFLDNPDSILRHLFAEE